MMTAAIRVLYVDDEPALLDIAKLYLEKTKEFTVTYTIRFSCNQAVRIQWDPGHCF